jgi:cytochrome c553
MSPMKKIFTMALLVCGFALALGAQNSDTAPAWAYIVRPADYKAPVDDGKVLHVPDSKAGWTLTQLNDFFFAADWHPGDHPPMPDVVAHGRKPDLFACGFCHRADGPGGPENASLAGLPKAYIEQQMADFKSGARTGAVPERLPTPTMIKVAKAASLAEIDAAAAYFSSIKPRKTTNVIETDTVPKTYVASWLLAPVNDHDKEPIGHRIIEVPEDLEQFEARDPRSQLIAYVPIGSIAKGKLLASTGADGKTLKCGQCHGPELKGLGPVPGLAGRSPSYLVRQLYDFQHGQRKGPLGGPMTLVVAKLTADDLINLAAYLASLAP